MALRWQPRGSSANWGFYALNYHDKLPNLRVITHHMGAMIPFFDGRVGPGLDQFGSRTSDEDYEGLLKSMPKRPIEYFRQFYADTALAGGVSGIRCGLDFFGAQQVVFASDCPFDPEKGLVSKGGAKKPTYTDIFSDWLCDMAAAEPKLLSHGSV